MVPLYTATPAICVVRMHLPKRQPWTNKNLGNCINQEWHCVLSWHMKAFLTISSPYSILRICPETMIPSKFSIFTITANALLYSSVMMFQSFWNHFLPPVPYALQLYVEIERNKTLSIYFLLVTHDLRDILTLTYIFQDH